MLVDRASGHREPRPWMRLPMHRSSRQAAVRTMARRVALRSQRKYQALASSSVNTNIPTSDPSIPPASGTDLFSRLPNEVLHNIIVQSGPIARHSVMLTCKRLRPFGQGVDGEVAPPLSQAEYIQFQKQLEAHSSRKLKHLYCPCCNTFKKATSSRTTFTDAQAVQNYSGRRMCLECGISKGFYNRRDVVIKKQKLFLCGGCRQLWPHEKEEKAVVDAVITRAFAWHSDSWGQGVEITIGSGRRRWCKPCRVVIANLDDSNAVRVRPVHMR